MINKVIIIKRKRWSGNLTFRFNNALYSIKFSNSFFTKYVAKIYKDSEIIGVITQTKRTFIHGETNYEVELNNRSYSCESRRFSSVLINHNFEFKAVNKNTNKFRIYKNGKVIGIGYNSSEFKNSILVKLDFEQHFQEFFALFVAAISFKNRRERESL